MLKRRNSNLKSRFICALRRNLETITCGLSLGLFILTFVVFLDGVWLDLPFEYQRCTGGIEKQDEEEVGEEFRS